VAKEMPVTCPKCGGSHFTQDPDALDTWFSSALWPFSTLGWPEDTADLEKFYPNAVLVTGYDIIFFWVARMIFMGLYNMGEAPFSDVYIHGLIRDSQGRKMSKSLGNGIDPLEIIEEYSADALRFAIITGNSAGNDIRWQDEKVEASRNFLNKVWNATRFVLMNLEEDIMDRRETAMANLEATDKWILSRMNTVVGEVTQNMEKYELGIAAQKIYDFTWSEYCDWYIELVKPRLYGEDEGSKLSAEYTLNTVLTTILKLLHPVVPFITEEIYAYLPGSGEAIIVAQWPEYDEALSYPQEEKDVVFLMEVIRNIRNIRAEADVPNSRKAELYFMTDNAEHESLLMTSDALLEKLASVSGVKTIEKDAVGDGFISAVIEDAEIFLSLEDLVDKEKEIARLQNEKKKIEKELARLNGKLGNEGFLQKAPEQVVAAEREKLAGYTEMMAKVEDRLAYFE
ncbi:MAG: class I tRNA ligase family protein, partial [Eubacterium sp.]